MTRVAVVGASPDLAEDILTVLTARGFDLARIRLLGDEDELGSTIEVGGGRARYGEAEPRALAGHDAVLFCGDGRLASELVPVAVDSAGVVLDASPFSRGQAGACLIVPEVNGALLDSLPPKTVLASPAPASVGLAVALAPLHGATRIRRVVTTILAGASVQGGPGVAALSRQSLLLMQGQGLDADEEPQHFAFNLRIAAASGVDGLAAGESSVAGEVSSLLGAPRFALHATVVHVPVFYGLAHSVYVETEESLAEEEVRSTFLQAPGLLLAEALTAGSSGEAHYDEAPDPCPGPIEVSGSEAVHLARLRVFAEEGFGRLAFWLCLDDQRKGIALNLVSTLERALHRAAR